MYNPEKERKHMRIIINNESSCTAEEALDLVQQVISHGRVSNEGKQYCHVTSFPEHSVYVVSSLLKDGDSFKILHKEDF